MVKLDEGIDWPDTSQSDLTELGVSVLAIWWWQNALEVPDAYDKTPNKLEFGSVTFCFVLYISTHYSWCICMVLGMQTSRSVGLHPETVIGVAKSPTPVVNLD